jgi:hypothetical protein
MLEIRNKNLSKGQIKNLGLIQRRARNQALKRHRTSLLKMLIRKDLLIGAKKVRTLSSIQFVNSPLSLIVHRTLGNNLMATKVKGAKAKAVVAISKFKG